MKKYISIVCLSVFVIGCSSSTDAKTVEEEVKTTAIDIELNGLTTPCECVDALSIIMDEMIAITDDKPISKTSIDDLLIKLDEVEDYCMDTKGFSKSEAKKCNGFDQLESKFDVVEDFIK